MLCLRLGRVSASLWRRSVVFRLRERADYRDVRLGSPRDDAAVPGLAVPKLWSGSYVHGGVMSSTSYVAMRRGRWLFAIVVLLALGWWAGARAREQRWAGRLWCRARVVVFLLLTIGCMRRACA